MIQRQVMRERRKGGLTLIELMVVIAIMAIVVGTGVLTTRAIRGTRPEQEAAARVEGVLQWARAQAMSEGTFYRLIPSTTSMIVERYRRTGGGWEVVQNFSFGNVGNTCPSPPGGLAPVDTVNVNLTGGVQPSGAWVFCDRSGRFAAAVEITAAGATRQWFYQNGTWRVSSYEK